MAQDDSAGRSFDLPEAFLDYLTSTPYSAEEYHALLQSPEERYVRIRDPTLSLATIAQRLQVDVTELVEVSWTKRFAQRHPTLRRSAGLVRSHEATRYTATRVPA
ncbi:Ribosomal RNA small subunit methyltransferase B [Durusdinium trenchii]|uniref:Ribosomal RNA small subunit methyltransferase B n=1 Tax=Durusdinium trenchii TaxID=1381693 RepID=A0ABP0R603_9DINO